MRTGGAADVLPNLIVGLALLAIGWGAKTVWDRITSPIYITSEQANWPPWLASQVDQLVRVPLYMLEDYRAKGYRLFKRHYREVRVKTREGDTVFLRRPR